MTGARETVARAICVLAVDDNPEILSLLRRGLHRRGFEVLACGDGESALRTYRDSRPDIVVLDLLLPDADGIDLCWRFREIDNVPIIMLTARDAIEDRVEGLRAGADDYVVKPFALEELVARIEAVLRRRPPGTREITYEDLTIDSDARRVVRGNRELMLTPTEFAILQVLAQRPDRVVSRELIASLVWPDSSFVDGKLVDAHITNLRRKLEEGGGRRIIRTVRGTGFTLR